MWIEAFWTCSQNIFQLFETIYYKFFHKEILLFTTKTRFSNEFSLNEVIPFLVNQDLRPILA